MLRRRTNPSARLLAVLICLILPLAAYSSIRAQEVRQARPEPRKEVELSIKGAEHFIGVGGRRLDCRVYGAGSPTVVLISGLNAPQSYWNSVVPGIAEKATVVTYDRPGMGKSEMGSLPTHGEQAANDLHALLEKLAVPKPYVVVGHSYGGSVARLFTSMFPKDVGGLILEDSQHESILDEQRKVLKGTDLETLENMVARMSDTANPKTEMDYNAVTREQVRKSAAFPKIPYVVITSGDRTKSVPPVFSEEARPKLIAKGMELQKKLVALVPGGKHIVVDGVGHNIHVDRPEALIEPLREMIDEVTDKAK